MAEFDLGQVAFVDRGAYSPAATYKMWDFITTIDSMYLYINNIPAIATDILDTDYWKCIADGKPATQAADLANEKAGLANQATIDANNAIDNIASTLAEKVDKETGKSLIADTEIEKLSKVDLVTEKVTPIDDDSIGLWDSVVNKFVRTKLSDFKTFLGLTFEKLSNKKSVIDPLSETEYPNSKAVADVIIPAEQVTAESLTVLNRRIEALETIIANSQYSKIDVLDEFNFFGKTNLILFGATSPSITPDFIGQFYINTTAGITYQSKGVTNSGDWKQTSN